MITLAEFHLEKGNIEECFLACDAAESLMNNDEIKCYVMFEDHSQKLQLIRRKLNSKMAFAVKEQRIN
jgi:hypothetical protein